jgi:enoyl-CoA hydratase
MSDKAPAAEAPVLTTVDGGILTITLNRPAVRNAVDMPMAAGIAAALERLDAEPGLAVGVITGAGSGFCSGLDMAAYEVTGELPNAGERGFAGIAQRSARAPLIAAVEGFAIAGGFEIALACDLIVAGRDAIFGLPEARHGLLAAGGGLFGLTRRVPQGAALELALTGEPIGAERAHEIGAVDALTEPGEALAAAHELAARIALNAPLSLAAGKDLLRRGWTASEAEFFELQNELAAPLLDSDDAAEGVRAFNERRPPRWSGR